MLEESNFYKSEGKIIYSSTVSTTTLAFPLSFKILDVLDQMSRKTLVKITERETMPFENKSNKTLLLFWHSFVWGSCNATFLNTKNLLTGANGKGKKTHPLILSVLFYPTSVNPHLICYFKFLDKHSKTEVVPCV